MNSQSQRADDFADFSDPAFSARVRRFVGVSQPMGLAEVRPRPEAVKPGLEICRLDGRIARFVHRRAWLD